MTNSDSSALKLKIHPTVFWTSTALIFFFVAFSLFNLAQMKEVLDAVQHSITTSTGWLFIAAVNIYLAIVVYLLFSRYGSIRLGGADARPEFTTWGWFSMLFSAGMGIGLVFWSVAEPIFHYSAPPWGEANTVESAELAMGITFFHWGLHAWALYALMALGLAYFSFNRGLPLTIRSVFYPILGERIHGWMGNTIDILAAVATLFGLATSLGLGAQQVNAGLDYLFAIGQGSTQQILLIAGITLMATVSVVLGLDKGIRRLSQFNMAAAIALLVFVFIAGPSLHLLDALVQNIGAYLANLPKLSLWTEAYGRGTWQHSWTIFYWAWWIAWSPFVGIFIARISRGRTIREFLLCVLLVPSLMTFLWLTIFGNSALFSELYGNGGITAAVNDNVATALFVLLDSFPWSAFTSALSVIVITAFFVTSSDSASLVVDIITAGGHPNPPTIQRIFWAIVEGVVAAVLLLSGGLSALQTGVIITGLPFALIILLIGFSLLRGLKDDEQHDEQLHS
ncbi:MAG: choline/glycine/proline betaine transport protein [Candidatus Latescibacterota bacterium]